VIPRDFGSPGPFPAFIPHAIFLAWLMRIVPRVQQWAGGSTAHRQIQSRASTSPQVQNPAAMMYLPETLNPGRRCSSKEGRIVRDTSNNNAGVVLPFGEHTVHP